MKFARSIFAAALVAVFLPIHGVSATPLAMKYEVSSAGGGLFNYDFTLTLDNNDGTWAAGQGWDWIIFGDAAFPGPSPLADFAFTLVPAGFTGGGSGGAHNGPTLCFGVSCVPPIWIPTFVGEAISWSGTSATFLGEGEMLWSVIYVGGGAQFVNFLVAAKVPEPATLALFAAGLAGLAFVRRRRLIA